MAASPAGSRKRRWLIGGLAAFATLIATLVIAVAVYDWDNARGFISQKVKDRTGRDLAIGHLQVRLFSLNPTVHVEQLTLANAPWGDPQPFISADTLDFSVSLVNLLRGRIVFPDVTLGEASVYMQRDREGRRNWVLGEEQEKTDREPPLIQRLTVNKGKLTVKDPTTVTDLVLSLQTTSDEKYRMAFSSQGKAKGYNFKAKGTSGGLLTLMDESTVYPIRLDATIGEARASFDGTITGLATLAGIDARLTIAGNDLAKLGDALRISLPDTAPYKLSGHLVRAEDNWRFNGFRGTVGASDLGGDFAVDLATKRPTIRAKLNSKLLDIKDLGGFIGAAPGEAAPKAPGKVLPANQINLEKLHRVDAHVTLTASEFRNKNLPLDHLSARLDLVDGVMKLDPVAFGVAGGTMNTRTSVDARAKQLLVNTDTKFQKLHIGQLIPGAKLVEKSVGALDGRLQLKGQGNSVAEVLGSSSGSLDLLSGGGEVSNLLVEVGGADIGEILGFLMGGDKQVQLRCAVASFKGSDGILGSEVFVVDTDDTYFGVKGAINLKDELLDFTITPLPKDVSILSLRGPLYVKGSFAAPKAGIEKQTLVRKIGAAVMLGLVNPLLALLPTIETGPGRTLKAPCDDLVPQLQASIQGTPTNVPQKRPARVSDAPAAAPARVQSASR